MAHLWSYRVSRLCATLALDMPVHWGTTADFYRPNQGDWNGINAGAFFLKVDPRSAEFLRDVMLLKDSKRRLHFFEQTAMSMLIQERRLDASGDVAYVPLVFFNDYGSLDMLKKGPHNETFQLHFPSRDLKVPVMLPLLRRVLRAEQTGEDVFASREEMKVRARMLKNRVQAFWRAHRP